MILKSIVPIIRIFDVAKAKEFYLEYLDFNLDWEHQFDEDKPLYLQVSRGSVVLHLSEHHGDCCPGAAMRIHVSDIESFHKAIQSKNYRYLNPGMEDMPWGTKEVSVKDPFGNRLVFSDG